MTIKGFILSCFSFIITGFVSSQNDEIPLWPNGVPGAKAASDYIEEVTYDKQNQIRGFNKVSKPILKAFLANKGNANGTAVIIYPGGGYSHLAINKEGYKVAQWFNNLGISAFVLKYRMPSDKTMTDKTIGPLQDAQEAMRLVRRNAEKWHLNPNKIGVLGFSAGGHLASTISTHYNDVVYKSDDISARPDFSILVYPVISMEKGVTHNGSKTNLLGKKPPKALIEKFSNEKQVNSNTPPTLLIHATDDKAVPVENSVQYYMALKKHSVPAEMHIYEEGGHGFGLGRQGTSKNWAADLKNWLLEKDYCPEQEYYLFSYFKGNGEDGLHFAYSEDGFSWTSLKNDTSFLTPKVGKDKLMRDPCIIKGADGKYHMVWTVSWTDQGIGYASSEDLIHWSEQQFIPVMIHEKEARNTWAPEITYDAKSKSYMIYWATTIRGAFPETQSKMDDGYNHRMYYTTTTDFKSFSDTKLLYDPGFNVIDATIKEDNGQFVMFLKDETREPAQKNLKIAYSNNLTGPYGKASESITGKTWVEGPTAIKIDGKWVVYFDKYTSKKYGALSSKDLKTWTDISDKIQFPKGTRHGTILKVPAAILEKLKAL